MNRIDPAVAKALAGRQELICARMALVAWRWVYLP